MNDGPTSWWRVLTRDRDGVSPWRLFDDDRFPDLRHAEIFANVLTNAHPTSEFNVEFYSRPERGSGKKRWQVQFRSDLMKAGEWRLAAIYDPCRSKATAEGWASESKARTPKDWEWRVVEVGGSTPNNCRATATGGFTSASPAGRATGEPEPIMAEIDGRE